MSCKCIHNHTKLSIYLLHESKTTETSLHKLTRTQTGTILLPASSLRHTAALPDVIPYPLTSYRSTPLTSYRSTTLTSYRSSPLTSPNVPRNGLVAVGGVEAERPEVRAARLQLVCGLLRGVGTARQQTHRARAVTVTTYTLVHRLDRALAAHCRCLGVCGRSLKHSVRRKTPMVKDGARSCR